MNDTNHLTVSQLTKSISVIFENNFSSVLVEGEISNYKLHSSGHRYFTLKDDKAQISCTMWKYKTVNFQPADGMKVLISGRVTVYPPRGQYQIECDSMYPLSLGELYLAYEQLKQKLAESGYFDESRKRPIPDFPLKIGVSTSPTGAAVQDIMSTISRRMPLCTVFFRPTLVQGEGSAEDIAKAIEELNVQNPDVIIIGRGGGSIEDLWSYNTEIVANTIFKSKAPVISAVGHETDFTIADFVADLRAATPTAAAELVTPLTKPMAESILNEIPQRLQNTINSRITEIRRLIEQNLKSYAFRAFKDRVSNLSQTLDSNSTLLGKKINARFILVRSKLNSLESHCRSLNPETPLEKGFALLKSEGKIISNNETLGNFIEIDIVRRNETASAYINKIKREKIK